VTTFSADLPDPLQVALASDPGRPRLTYYDDTTGERVELSAQSLAGWVTKTMNLLMDDVGVDQDTVVSLHLPLHWLTAVWVLAADAAGAILDTGGHGELPVVEVDAGFAVERFAVSLRPMAAPLGRDCPPSLRDFCAEVRGMPDQLVRAPDAASGALAVTASGRAAALGLRIGERVAVHRAGPELVDAAAVVDSLLAVLAVDGSAVWTRNPDPAACVSRWQAEQVSAVMGPLPEGFSGPVPEPTRHLSSGTP
jgi:uncharacterized protein (TIGR03089 family)